jgi:Lon protease-like protein
MTRELPMFPLGTVLLPHMVLPLHVFEPRYRALMHDVLPTDREFGIVRIREGSEVGGGDRRDDVGTIARVLQAQELDDGRWIAVTVGTRRIRIEGWLDDAPYPRALVHELAEDAVDARTLQHRDELARRLRRLLAQRAELGLEAAPSTFDLAEDDATSCWQLIVLAPLDVIMTQQLLATDGWDERLAALDRAIAPLESGASLGLAGA